MRASKWASLFALLTVSGCTDDGKKASDGRAGAPDDTATGTGGGAGNGNTGSTGAAPGKPATTGGLPTECGMVEGSKTIRNAGDVDELSGCTGLTGNLTIIATGLVSLAGLETLTEVGGDLYIQGTDILSSVDGLSGLTTVGGDLSVDANRELRSVAKGLGQLRSVGGSFTVSNNPLLPSAEISPVLMQIGLVCTACCGNADDALGACGGGNSSSSSSSSSS